MNSKIFLISLFVPFIFLLSGCGAHKDKNLLLKLSPEITKPEATSILGEPNEVHCSAADKNGNVVDVWIYNLATINKSKRRQIISQQVCGWLLFWPILCFPSSWQNHIEYDDYFLKFVNHLLVQWGRVSDMKSDTYRFNSDSLN